MATITGAQLAVQFSEALRRQQIAGRLLLPRSQVQALIENRQWEDIFSRWIANEERVRCTGLVELAEQTLNELCPPPEEGWLRFSFAYARDILFPDEAFAARR